MIVDNADDADILFTPLREGDGSDRLIDYVPKVGKGSVLFTTRTAKVAVDLAGNNLIELGAMSRVEAVGLLKTRLRSEQHHQLEEKEIVDEFLDMLTFFVLAIVQAVAFINKNSYTLSVYISLYRSNDNAAAELLSKDFEDDGRYRDIRNAVTRTWAISFEQVQRQDRLAAEYLLFMACTANTDIPASMLPESGSPVEKAEAFGTLKAYAFITERKLQRDDEITQQAQHERDQAFDIHPLVHLATRAWMEEQNQWDPWVGKTLVRMLELVPFENPTTRKTWMTYLPHAYHVTDLEPTTHENDRTMLLNCKGGCEFTGGHYKKAERSFREVVKHLQERLGMEHEDTLRNMGDLGLALLTQGKFKEGEQRCRTVLAIMERVYGKEHEFTLQSSNYLVSALGEQKNYREAEEICQRTVKAQEKVLGKEHQHTLGTMFTLALVLYKQEKYVEAEEICRRTAEARERVLGKEHPDTLRSMHNLVSVLDIQGKHVEAEKMCQRIVKLQEKVVGKEHKQTLESMYTLATVLNNQGKLVEAEEMCQRTIEAQEKVLGKEHVGTLRSLSLLSAVLLQLGHYKEAFLLFERAVEGYKNTVGLDHPYSRSYAEDYAWAQSQANKDPSASDDLPLPEEAQGEPKNILGSELSKTQPSARDTALTQQDKDRESSNSEDSAPSRQAQEPLEKPSGSKNPETQSRDLLPSDRAGSRMNAPLTSGASQSCNLANVQTLDKNWRSGTESDTADPLLVRRKRLRLRY